MNKPDNVQEVLQWLLDPTEEHRGTGRTTELIHAYILVAIKHNNTRIAPQDHYRGQQIHHRDFVDLLMHIARQQYRAFKFVKYPNESFSCAGLNLPNVNGVPVVEKNST